MTSVKTERLEDKKKKKILETWDKTCYRTAKKKVYVLRNNVESVNLHLNLDSSFLFYFLIHLFCFIFFKEIFFFFFFSEDIS